MAGLIWLLVVLYGVGWFGPFSDGSSGFSPDLWIVFLSSAFI